MLGSLLWDSRGSTTPSVEGVSCFGGGRPLLRVWNHFPCQNGSGHETIRQVKGKEESPMEALADSMVTESAVRLGLDLTSQRVNDARITAREAIRNGCSLDDAVAYARSVLNPATSALVDGATVAA